MLAPSVVYQSARLGSAREWEHMESGKGKRRDDESVSGSTVLCACCSKELNESVDCPKESREPCPRCGSTARCYRVSLAGQLCAHSMLKYKARTPGVKKPFAEGLSGTELFRNMSKWIRKTRVIDRREDRYSEQITDIETGETIHCCDEPLSEHKGHGSARKG